MESALIVLVWIVGLVVITFFVVIIIAVLKVTSETDDIEERIHYQTTQALEEREHGISQETSGTERGTAHDGAVGEDIRDREQNAL